MTPKVFRCCLQKYLISKLIFDCCKVPIFSVVSLSFVAESSLFTRFSADDNPFVEQEEEEEGEDLMDTGGVS